MGSANSGRRKGKAFVYKMRPSAAFNTSLNQSFTNHKQPSQSTAQLIKTTLTTNNPQPTNTMLSRALLSLAGCLLAVSMVASQGAAPDTGIRYLCNANRERVGARKSDGSVARVDTKRVPTTPFSGFCNCLSGGLACPTPPDNNMFTETLMCTASDHTTC
ncbi:hypothetical protein Pst134EA_025757 [Puccinia striiformis f. sp. tritici]|uniref:hypothetical protein n=1 Tax=Puccinia striiformis f. sp. tritici TaxID=168172 RepID=UPI000A1263A5|nr:hypothetical protein Pst134EA_025757 [Puccinia striiformis f. sp. tritici]KAH9451820.1 hypothetical protein Pst134EA_025757 [Puccinia striiformis f. sp. tritici]